MKLSTRWWLRLAAGAALASFFVLERRLRQGQVALDLDPGEWDGGSTALVGAAFGLGIVGPPFAALVDRSRLPVWTGWAGVAAMAAALPVRWWAAATLGASYTRTLQVSAGQRVVAEGPYRYVRHPGYAADILMWMGYGLAWTSRAAVFLTAVPIPLAFAYRIRREDRMLRDSLGEEYQRYSERTARLIPGIV